MSPPPTVLVELVSTGLVLGFTVWVLGVQPLSLARSMPREKFLGLQMRIVRIWSRTLVPLTLAGGAATWVRVGARLEAVPAVAAIVAALVTSLVAIPRAIKAGGESVRADGDEQLTGGGFLSEGGGASTRVWHRVVLVCVLSVLGGRTIAAYTALSSLV